jgi:hypothetical protein
MNKFDLRIFDALAIVVIDGFEPEVPTFELEDGTTMRDPNAAIDLPGSANWLVEQYGMAGGNFCVDPRDGGILWTDYDLVGDGTGRRFSVLMDADEVDDLRAFAQEAGYDIARVDEVDEPMNYGDYDGSATICKHPDGWLVFT